MLFGRISSYNIKALVRWSTSSFVAMCVACLPHQQADMGSNPVYDFLFLYFIAWQMFPCITDKVPTSTRSTCDICRDAQGRPFRSRTVSFGWDSRVLQGGGTWGPPAPIFWDLFKVKVGGYWDFRPKKYVFFQVG